MKLLFVIDMQNDFIDGVLGSPEAQAIVPKVIEKIRKAEIIIFTKDSHNEDYLKTEEGKHLPILHCQVGKQGWTIRKEIFNVTREKDSNNKHVYIIHKNTFGYPWDIEKNFNNEDFTLKPNEVEEIEIVGLDTDFCVLANAMILKAAFPNVPITIDASCCAGSTPEWHEKALDILEHCHFNIINRE